jgi:hypothetical protein
VPAALWVIYGEDRFQWNTTTVGLSLAAFGATHAIFQAFVTGPLSSRLGERRTLLFGMAADATGFILLAFATQGWMVFPILLLLAAGGVGMPALQAMLSNNVSSNKQGSFAGNAYEPHQSKLYRGTAWLHGTLFCHRRSMERLGLDCRRDPLFNMSANTTQTFRNFIVIESWRIGMRRLRRNDGLNPLSNHLLSGRVPMMTLVHTLAVAEYLNFRHAANALGVAQSSVSARVKALEKTSASSCSSVMRAASG